METTPPPEEHWKKNLTPEQYQVLRQCGTEPPFTGQYLYHKGDGVYQCAACGQGLFTSDAKFDSGSGWPSFWQPLTEKSLLYIEDASHGMRRIEVRCGQCHSHLGHVFEDGPQPTGLRYCINSLALGFSPGSAQQQAVTNTESERSL